MSLEALFSFDLSFDVIFLNISLNKKKQTNQKTKN